jgi:hypothetical protein
MSQAKKVKAIYSVLRGSAELDLFTSGQLYEGAGALVALFDPAANEPNFDLRIGGRALSEWAADMAMRSHPWRLVCEEHAVPDAFEYEDEHEMEVRDRIKFLLEYSE